MELPDKIVKKLKDLPDKPGCYLMRDGKGKIIYVGKAVSLRKRVQTYFRNATRRSADPKLRSLVKSIRDLDYIVVRNEAEAILTEGQMIKDYKPYYNVHFKDDKRFLLLRVDIRDTYPVFSACRIRKEDGAVYFGPYISSRSAKAAVDFVEKRFGIRKCKPRLPDESTYKHCINDIVRFCSAPCAGRISPAEYRGRIDEACAFLRGERLEYLKELREEMNKAATAMQFERAAVLRDTLFNLQATIKQKAKISQTPAMKKEDGLIGVTELGSVLGLKNVPRAIEAYDISNISGTYSVAGMVCSVNGIARAGRYRRFKIKTIEGANDPGMMGEVIKRRFSRLVKEGGEMPDLVIVDGGITQLRAARAALEQLGMDTLPVAGLAKRYEEIYWNDTGVPIRLPKDSSALKILQRLRDEAHRFALTYHRQLRSRRIRESVLDEIPGIGPERKCILLKHFGSVRKMMKASEKDIAGVPGIGSGLAKIIKDGLSDHTPVSTQSSDAV